jgi:hypothetical protein
LLAGSVTVLQAPFPKTFTLNMQGNQLILNKGYKLQDIRITSTVGSATLPIPAAVGITDPTAGLASVDVQCDPGSGNKVFCVEVAGAGSHILKDVRVDVKDTNTSNIGILNNATNVNLTIVGGRVRPTGNNNAITLIKSQGVLTVTGLEVDMTNAGHAKASIGIVLNAAGSSVTGSTIYVSNPSSPSAKGIDVQAGPSIVEDNTFIAPGGGANSIGIIGGANLSNNALLKNNFSGFPSANKVQL